MKNVKKAFMAITTILLLGALFSACQKEELPASGFDYSPAEITQWDQVTFNNTSTKGDTYAWDFGDGSTSTDENPTHVYVTAGTFTVSLEATNTDGSNTITKDLTVLAPVNIYTVDGTEYAITEAFEYIASMPGATKYWRMLGDAFDGATADPGPPVNLLKFYPNLGTGDLEGDYTFDDSDEPPTGTFDYGFTANYKGMQYDSTAIGFSGTLKITEYAEDIYEFKLENGTLKYGAFDWGTGEFILNGTETSFSVIYRGVVDPI